MAWRARQGWRCAPDRPGVLVLSSDWPPSLLYDGGRRRAPPIDSLRDRRGRLRIKLSRLIYVILRRIKRRLGVLVRCTHGPQVQLIGLEVLGAALPPIQGSAHELDLQRLHDRVGDLVLNREDVVQRPVIASPTTGACCRRRGPAAR